MYFAFYRSCLGAWTGVSTWCPVPGACRDLGLRRRVLGNQASPHFIMNVSTFLLSPKLNRPQTKGLGTHQILDKRYGPFSLLRPLAVSCQQGVAFHIFPAWLYEEIPDDYDETEIVFPERIDKGRSRRDLSTKSQVLK